MSPGLVLLCVAFPSFSLLYKIDENTLSDFQVKVYGNQWYWNYEYSKCFDYAFSSDYLFRYPAEKLMIFAPVTFLESYMTPDSVNKGWIDTKPPREGYYRGRYYYADLFRLLEVTENVSVPETKKLRLLITATDVLHSWAVPSLGIKLDACPGRLNEISVAIKRLGYFYGQCSEICGSNHAFMPININFTCAEDFMFWARNRTYGNTDDLLTGYVRRIPIISRAYLKTSLEFI